MCADRSFLRREISIRTSPVELLLVSQSTEKSDAGIENDATTANVFDVRLRKLMELIEANPLSTIRDWALAFNLSHSHLQRLFKQATGVALGRALTEKRLRRAADLLLHTNLSVKEVAHAVGYEHTSSFTRAFGRYFEERPRHYRRRNAA